MNNGKPLVSFGLIAYEQERFVREAIAGAFAQNYSPLEIVLSDDCSKDATFSVMQEMAAAYKGPHRIILNRNSRNLGLGGNVNRVIELSHGKLIVIAAGDDVSLPERTEWLYRAWQQAPERVMALQSAYDMIDEEGRFVATVRKIRAKGRDIFENASKNDFHDYVRTLRLPMSGATFAYNRKIFETFGLLPEKLVFEDNLITLRALLLGGLWMVDKPLIRRRAHGANLMLRKTGVPRGWSAIQKEEDQARLQHERRCYLYESFVSDIRTAEEAGLLKPEDAMLALAVCRERAEYFRLQSSYHECSFIGKLRILQRLSQLGMPFGGMRSLLTRLIPWPILRAGKAAIAPFRPPVVDPVLRGAEDFGIIDS